MLLLGLLLVLVYAVFAHGATETPAETRVQLALVLGALPVLIALTTGRSGLRIAAPPLARAGVGLLFAFAAWCALSLLWSVAPDDTWTEVNRAFAYALIAGLGLVAGASTPRALERLATGYLLLAVLVALYALGSKTIPGVHVLGLVDFDQTGTLARLRVPLDYWNALALLLAMALPVAVRIAVDRTRTPVVRTLAVLAAHLLVIDLGMTLSRGGVLAVVVLLTVLTAFGRDRLRSLLVVVLAAGTAAAPLALAFTKHGLSDSGVPLGLRIHDGRLLLGVVVVVAVVLVGLVRLALAYEDRVVWSAARTRTLGRVLVVGVCGVLLLGVVGATGTTRGLPGTVENAVRGFTVPSQDKQLDPSRLATTTSGNRWVWWQEAAGAFSDRPVGGWGAGSFRVTHLRYRTNTISVTQPHSVPLQFLSETGLVGFLLAYAGIGLLVLVGVRRVRAMDDGRERELGVALLAASVAWLAHGVYDWDWDIPGITLPPLLFLGVLAGGAVRRPVAVGPAAPVVVFLDPEREARLRPGALTGVALATIALFAYATSAVLPAWSANKADAAQAAIGGDQVSDEQLRAAAAKADLAAKLDPLDIEPLLVSATIAQRRGRDLEARRFLLDAVHRQPDSSRAWSQLASLLFPLADRKGFQEATARALALDPHNPLLRTLAFRAVSFATPAGESATSSGTPLPPAPVVFPAGTVASP
ncbi:MAG: hypothetical protein JWM31_1078, partial [Solirubrobacterales bacterium]|nr:hypothetical protein [Solirubrobacterales bacterium]